MSEDINQSIIKRLLHIVRCSRQRPKGNKPAGLEDMTILQMQALMHVKHSAETKMSDLSDALGLSASSASLLVDRLVAGDWIMRVPDNTDRRIVYLRLTPRIDRHFSKTFRVKMSKLEQQLDILTDNDKCELDRILAILEGRL